VSRHFAVVGDGAVGLCAEAGAAVVLADVRATLLQSVAEQLVADGHRAIGVACDVRDDAQVAAMVDQTVATFGQLDAAFNNAGVMASIAPTADSTREDWERVIDINLRGAWSCMKYELPQVGYCRVKATACPH
jgi:NAD(P)-dependent dehydrogenase (short-subunit alcohol dehydrogenase family)